jgi:hypothetical protein
MGFEHGRDVGAQKGHPVMLLQPDRPQPRSQSIDPLRKVTIGLTSLTMNDGYFIRQQVSTPPQKIDRGEFGPIDIFLLLFRHISLLWGYGKRSANGQPL